VSDPRMCLHCKRAEDRSPDERGMMRVELRPYGPGGALICFECAMHPKRLRETKRQFAGRLAVAGKVALLTDEGPAPARSFMEDLKKGRAS